MPVIRRHLGLREERTGTGACQFLPCGRAKSSVKFLIDASDKIPSEPRTERSGVSGRSRETLNRLLRCAPYAALYRFSDFCPARHDRAENPHADLTTLRRARSTNCEPRTNACGRNWHALLQIAISIAASCSCHSRHRTTPMRRSRSS